MSPLLHPYLHAIFCDEVRQEVTGKMLYIGVYNGELIAPAYPVVLPKLVLTAHYGHPFEAHVGDGTWKAQSLRLMLDDEVLLELDELSGNSSPPPSEGSRGHLMTFMMAMAPLQLNRPGRLRVKITLADGSELLSNSLMCRLPTEAEQAVAQEH